MKCDRQRPCQNCVARGTPLSCSYAAQSGIQSLSKSSVGGTEDIRTRVNRLEALVISLMPQSNGLSDNGTTRDATAAISGLELRSLADEEPKDEDVPEAESYAGTMERNINGQHYVGESHWDAVLRDVCSIHLKRLRLYICSANLLSHRSRQSKPMLTHKPSRHSPGLLSLKFQLY